MIIQIKSGKKKKKQKLQDGLHQVMFLIQKIRDSPNSMEGTEEAARGKQEAEPRRDRW